MNKYDPTLMELGIRNPKELDIETKLESDAILEENVRLYKAVNEKFWLPAVEENDPGECFHITGEMRALADRLHRKICRKMKKKYNSKFNIACMLPKERKYSEGTEILYWMKRDWSNLDLQWTDYLDVFDLIGNAEVNLYTLQEPEAIHYSVFAGEYVLLQEKHKSGDVKAVWLLKSKPLFEILRSRAKKIIDRSKPLSARIFRELTLSVSNSTALHILSLLNGNTKILISNLHPKFDEAPSFQNSYSNLKALGLVETVGDFSQITEPGRQYLDLFQ